MAEAPTKSSREKSSKSTDKDDKSKTHKLSLKGMKSDFSICTADSVFPIHATDERSGPDANSNRVLKDGF